MEETERECTKCNKTMHITLFEFNRKYKSDGSFTNNRRHTCNECRLKMTRARRNASKEVPKIMRKTCLRCKFDMPVSEFTKRKASSDGLCSYCKNCVRETRPRKTDVVCTTEDTRACSKCGIIKTYANFRKTAKAKTGYYKTCNDCWAPRQWTREKQRESQRKMVITPNRAIRLRLNHQIALHLKGIGSKKNKYTAQYVGCTIEQLKTWFEYQFDDNMSWDNIGSWHIDHVMPCAQYDLTVETQLFQCFNWTNLRPCPAKVNISKRDKVIPTLIKKQKELVTKFLKTNPLPTLHGNIEEGKV